MLDRPPEALLRPLVPEVATLEIEVVRLVGLRRKRLRNGAAPPIGEAELGLVGNRLGDFFLHRQQAAQPAIVLPRPQVSLVADLDQLGGDSHAAGVPPHAPLQHVLHSQLAGQAIQRLAATFVARDGGPRDHPQPLRIEVAQSGDHLFRQAIAEVLLRWIAREILEGEHRQRYFSPGRWPARGGAGPEEPGPQTGDEKEGHPHQNQPTPGGRLGNRGRRDGRKVFGSGHFPRVGAVHRGDEAIPPARDGLDESGVIGVIPEDAAELADGPVDAVVGIEEDLLPPDPLRDLFPGDQLSSSFHQQKQQIHRDALQLEHSAGAAQLVGPRVELEILPQSDRFLGPCRLGRHGCSPVLILASYLAFQLSSKTIAISGLPRQKN